MNKPSKCKNCEWYGKPYWSVINPCDNCNREDYYKVMDTYYTEEYVKSLLQEIERIEKEWKSKLDDVSMLTSRIYNAINYINKIIIPYGDEWHWDDGVIRDYVLHLLNILQNGSDDNE